MAGYSAHMTNVLMRKKLKRTAKGIMESMTDIFATNGTKRVFHYFKRGDKGR